MNIATIKQRLHDYLEVADDKKVKAIYTMVEESISEIEYNDELKKEIDRRYKSYKKNPSTAFSQVESKSRVEKLLNAARK